MGAYVYKVINKIVRDSEGRPANLTKFAYKPWPYYYRCRFSDRTGEDMNRTLAWKAKCHLAERYVDKSANYTGRVVMEEGGPSIECRRGTFSDDWFFDRVEEKETA